MLSPKIKSRVFLIPLSLLVCIAISATIVVTSYAGEYSITDVRATLTDDGVAGVTAEVSFSPLEGASVLYYMALSSPGGITAVGSSNPISMTGLDRQTTYTFTVTAFNPPNNIVSDPSPQVYLGDDQASEFTVIPLTGFNEDLVANGPNSVVSSTSIEFDNLGRVFYAKSFSDENTSGMTNLVLGLPDDGLILSETLPQGRYQLADYSGNNALHLYNASEASSGSLELQDPSAFKKLSILSSSAYGDSTMDITVHFTNGLPTTFAGIKVNDWYGGNNYAIKGTGRVSRLTETGDEEDGDDPRIYDAFIELSSEDSARIVESITFTKTAGSSRLAIFAISGEALTVNHHHHKATLVPKIINTLRFSIDSPDYYLTLGLAPEIIKSMDTAPILSGDRTLLPIRFVIEPLGGNLLWDSLAKKITIIRGATTIELWIGSNTALVNGVEQIIDPANPDFRPLIVKPGRAFLPLRFIAEALGCSVNWDSAMRQILVTDW